MLYKETVEAGTLDLILRLAKDEMLAAFYLAGDTALSLQIGHRVSVDIDLCCNSSLDAVRLSGHLATKYKAESIKTLNDDVSCFVEAVKVDLRADRYTLVQPPVLIEAIRMASTEEIGAVKLKAIVAGSNRFTDFVDLYSLLEHNTLEELTDVFEKKYPAMSRSMVTKALSQHNEIVPASVTFTGQEVTGRDLDYRFKKALGEPKRIFETVPWQRQTAKKARGDQQSPDKSRGKGWRP